MISIKKLIGSVALLLLFTQVNGQEELSLAIGDPAPPLKYSKWLKGEPVTSFKGDQLYILEFWATWCTPCKAAMPHLTELQKKYEGKVNIIGVDIWENIKEGQPYESSLPKVERYVQGNSANMGYSVIADNNDEHMGNNWMKAAGQTGIPATFIIKNGKVIWIGHPMALDTLLPKIFDGSYDMAAHKIKSDRKLEKYKKSSAAVRAELKPINDALAAKEYEKAYELMGKLAAEKPARRGAMYRLKFTTFLQQGKDEEAIAVANEWQKQIKSAPVSIFLFVSDKDNLSKKIYLWAVKLYEAYYPGPYAPLSFHARASMYAKGGDYQTAIALEEKAIEGAKAALEKGELEGIITDHTVEEYDKALAGYKKDGKAKKSSK